MSKTLLCRIALIALLLFPAINMLHAGMAVAQTVSGTVVSATDKSPLIGATVRLDGASSGSVTDIDGKFSIRANNGQTLVVAYIGYVTQRVTVRGSGPLTIELAEEATSLNDVVVVGYGVQKKKLVTGATLQVTGDNVAKMNTSNPLQALQGQTPGMSIVQNSGQPGDGFKVNIRGIGTNGSSSPLYIIDGVRGDITNINPADIESIDVLKDAASAAIYGSQAANGVVLVTTKSGKEGRTVVSFDSYFGIQNAARQVDMLNAQQYMAIMDEQNVNSGSAPYDWTSYKSIYDANGNVYNTDWIDQMIEDDATTMSATLGITGGNARGNYAMSLGYLNQEGVIGGKDVSYYERYNFRINSEYDVISNLLRVGEQVGFAYSTQRGINVSSGGMYDNYLRDAFNASPLAPVYSDNNIYDSPYNDTSNSDWSTGEGNPYAYMMTRRRQEDGMAVFTGNVFAELEPIKNLKLRSTLGVRYTSSTSRSMEPLYQFSPYQQNTDRTTVAQSGNSGFAITWTNTLSYSWSIDQHNFDAMIGTESYQTTGQYVRATQGGLRAGFDTWDYAWVNNGTGLSSEEGLGANGNPWDEERMMSYFGRLSWNWQEKYMATVTMRRDGSSRFARGKRFGTFPSVSAGWVLTSEDFMKPVTKVMDYFKLRVSWGQVGNQNIGNYMYSAPMSTSGIYYNFGSGLGSSSDVLGAYPSRIANEDITWETSEQFDLGFDARFLNQRLNVNFDFYIKTTKDWLVQPPILATVGTGAPYINGGDVKNTGVELALGWNDRIGSDFNYYVNVNGAYNKNEVGSIPNEDGIIHGPSNDLYNNSTEFYRVSNGEPIGYFWGYKTAGLFQNQDDIASWVAAGNGVLQADVQPGDVKYVDVNHDGVIDDSDKVNLGNGMPDFTFGFTLGFDYKGFDFSLTANGSVGNKIVQSYRDQSNSLANYTTEILNRWTGEGTSNKIPRVTNTNINWQFSDLYVHDGDFLRISNITLGYDFSKLIDAKWLSQARLYVQVQNAFTFTKYTGMDPEIGFGNSDYGWVSGIDRGYYPRPRTVLFGVNLKF